MSFSLHNSRFGLYVDFTNPIQGQIQDLKFGEEHLQKLRRAEVDTNFFGVFRVKNRDFTPPPGSAPAIDPVIKNTTYIASSASYIDQHM